MVDEKYCTDCVCVIPSEVYLKKDADKAIEELKEKLMPCLNGDCILTCEVVEKYGKENAELKQKLEDAGKRERRLKRALWLARAERANESHFMWCQFIYDKKYGIVKFNVKKEWGENVKHRQTLHTPQGWSDVWDDVERKCRAKAEEYK